MLSLSLAYLSTCFCVSVPLLTAAPLITHPLICCHSSLLATHLLICFCSPILATHHLIYFCSPLLATYLLIYFCSPLLATDLLVCFNSPLLITHLFICFRSPLLATDLLICFCVSKAMSTSPSSLVSRSSRLCSGRLALLAITVLSWIHSSRRRSSSS